jgi:LPS-assembly lipoprotein
MAPRPKLAEARAGAPRTRRPRAWARGPALAAVACLVGLAGCGFQLRGAVELPPAYRAVHVRASDPLVGEPLKLYLEAGGARLAASPAEADLTLAVTREARDRRVTAVDPRTGKPREYELAYALTYEVAGRKGDAILPPETVRLVREYTFEADAVLAKGEEEAVIYADMREDAVQQILRQLRLALGGARPADAGQR